MHTGTIKLKRCSFKYLKLKNKIFNKKIKIIKYQ